MRRILFYAKEGRDISEYLRIQSQIDQFANRIRRLSEASAALEEIGALAVPDGDWVELYRTLVELHDAAADGMDPLVIAPLMVQLGIKLTMLEIMVDRRAKDLTSRTLH